MRRFLVDMLPSAKEIGPDLLLESDGGVVLLEVIKNMHVTTVKLFYSKDFVKIK